MVNHAITSITGWLLLALLITSTLYPFLLRRGFSGPVQPFLQRMQFHYLLGYCIASVVLVHTFVSMMGGMAVSINANGLYLATGALFLIYIQVMLGRRLQNPKLSLRRLTRRWHFWVMISIVVLVSGHIVLNSIFLQTLVVRL